MTRIEFRVLPRDSHRIFGTKFLEFLFDTTFPLGGREGCVLRINKVNSHTGYRSVTRSMKGHFWLPKHVTLSTQCEANFLIKKVTEASQSLFVTSCQCTCNVVSDLPPKVILSRSDNLSGANNTFLSSSLKPTDTLAGSWL